ncbi:MAG: toxin [Acidobacteriia bacterium]|nr:toxin [Terriglobia bacterium]
MSFDEIVFHIERGDVLDILEHPNQERYEGQRVFVVRLGDYVCLAPLIEEQEQVVLKTIIPSRKATKQYLRREAEDDEA